MDTEKMLALYHSEIPGFMRPFLTVPEMVRLSRVGMNCGCEYTAFPLFSRLPPYSRFDHSLGAALITWHFTGDRAQALAALFHDIATPAFAHVVDFLHGDHMAQESTEALTETVIGGSAFITALLRELGLSVEEVADYHRYPIADNDAPRLSADRLEYTMGNLLGYGFCTLPELQGYYGDLLAADDGEGTQELAFMTEEAALGFAGGALRCSRVYTAPEDRYTMQMIAELIADAAARGVLTEEDLYRTEPEVITLLTADRKAGKRWAEIRALCRMVRWDEAPANARRVIHAKKRRIDPLVAGRGRLSALSPAFAAELAGYMTEKQDEPLAGTSLAGA